MAASASNHGMKFTKHAHFGRSTNTAANTLSIEVSDSKAQAQHITSELVVLKLGQLS
jgi:hypothetical protein